MAQVTRAELITATRWWMDAVGNTGRWDDTTDILPVLDNVFDTEWSNILSVAPYYRAAQRVVTTDTSGKFALSSLDSGSGDTAQRFYRVLAITDDNYIYDETRFQDVPLATTTNWALPYQWYRLYYLFGTTIQILPVASGVSLNVWVNYKPPVPSDLSGDAVTVDYPDNSHLILAQEAGARLLMKSGAESAGAAQLSAMADQNRQLMLLDLQRRTINPVRVMPVDDARDWAGR